MRTIGIIGGLGPETTAEFYMDLIFSAYKIDPSARPPILTWSIPLPYQIEQDLIVNNHGMERYIPYLVDAAKRLQEGGADFIVIPCNSVHIFIEEVRHTVRIPVLSIIETTAEYVSKLNIKTVGLLGTSTLLDSGMYQNALRVNKIESLLPNKADQLEVGNIINRLVRSRYDEVDKKKLITIIDRFDNLKTKHILLACTDLQLIVPNHPTFEILDTMELLVNASVEQIFS